jgi:hypothetical protein
MTPKETAEYLLDTMSKQTYQYQEYAGSHYTTAEVGLEAGKKCAIIAVDEILYVLNEMDDTLSYNSSIFYNEIKQEIEKL